MPSRFYAFRGLWTMAAFLLLLGLSVLQAQEAPPAGPPYRVGGGVLRPEKISGAPPAYTDTARKARVMGVVILEAVIDEQGNVTDMRVLKGLPMGLTEAALEAVRSWKFKPATLEGRPVPVYYSLTVNFQIDAGPGFGPKLKEFLDRDPDFAALYQGRRYQEAAELLDRRAAERPGDTGIQLARVYLLVEQGRLEDAWHEAQAYRGPEPYEILQRIGSAAWSEARDPANPPEVRANAVELGLQAEDLALQERGDSFEATVYKIVLLRAKAKLVSDPDESTAVLAEADRLRERAVELQKEGKAVGTTLDPAAMEAMAGSADKAFENMTGGPITPPERISGDVPVMTRKARKAGVSGVVVVEAVIDEQGNVRDVRIQKSLSEELDEVALKAIRSWKFKPGTIGGKPVKVNYTMTVAFH